MSAQEEVNLDSVILRMGKEGAQPFLPAVREAMRMAADALDVERASAWLFRENGRTLALIDLYERSQDMHSADLVLERSHFPQYFKAIEDDKVLAIQHVDSDPRTMEFTEGYTEPLGIRSMLDGAIRLAGDVVGVVCFEQVGSPRDWTGAEATFTVEVTSLIAQWLMKRERDEAERHIDTIESRYREIIEDAHLLVQMVLPDGRIEFVNNSWLRALGYTRDEVDGLDFKDLIHPDSLDHCIGIFTDVMQGEAGRDMEATFVTKAGEALEVSGAIVPRLRDGVIEGTHALLQDITDRKAIEAQLIHAQKMEQVGRLTAGLAHDFGNTLTVVSMNTSLIRRRFTEDSQLLEDLGEIQGAAEDGLALVRDLMGFSRKADLKSTTLELSEVVAASVPTLRRLLTAQIQIEFEDGNGGGRIVADEGVIRRVLLNLATNARDAMDGPGRLLLSVSDASPDIEVPEGIDSTEFLRLAVKDDASGMDSETLALIFDPFFTTKEAGKGTGLGLASIKGLVEQQGGFITVESTLGVGTTFHIYFPRSDSSGLDE